MRITKGNEGRKYRLYEFDSLADYAVYSRDAKETWNRHSSLPTDASWYGTKSRAEAVRFALTGWADGRKRMTDKVNAARFLQVGAVDRVQSYDVAGMYPHAGRAAAGAPDCMVTLGDEDRKPTRIFRFVVAINASCGVSAEVVMNRGAAILSWVDQLEANGGRCEIIVSNSASGAPFHYCSTIMLKGAGEPLDIDRCAFALVNPSMLRRLTFAAYEKIPELEAYGSGYGCPDNWMPKETLPQHSIYFECMRSAGPYTDIGRALAAVEAAIATMQQQEDAPVYEA